MKKINIVGLAWHTPHNRALAHLPFVNRYDYVYTNREYSTKQRPFPEKARYIPHIPDDNDYDLAILHIDQQIVEPRISKGQVFHDLYMRVRYLGIPLVVINHMTPYSDRLSTQKVVEKVKRLLGDTHMVTNSRKAAEQWGFGYPIIHGLFVDEWYDNPKEPVVLTTLSDGGMERAYRRRLLTDTQQIMQEKYAENILWLGGDLPHRESFEDYRDFISRALIYFNPTYNSPMPRARTEAMLSGACVVSTKHHDWESYIDDGVNGVIVKDNPEYCARVLSDMLKDYENTYKMGQRGKKMAREVFNHKNFAKQWIEYLTKMEIL